MSSHISRRGFLALGCSAAASPLLTPVSFAATGGDFRLVVIVLRGAMDGLSVVPPIGDRSFASLRPTDGIHDIGGGFGLHAGLEPLLPLWMAGQMGAVHAVSTPYRDKRSHFDGQDILEAGTGNSSGQSEGWLNRVVQALPGARQDTAYAVGRESMLILEGAAQVSRWSPDVDLSLSPQALALAQLVMSEDPAFAQALSQAEFLAGADGDPVVMTEGDDGMMGSMMQDMEAAGKGNVHKKIASFVAGRLKEEARIASFSVNGWDTHDGQDRNLRRPMQGLVNAISTLHRELGPVWDRTAVVAVTEFGRTVRMNGNKGTDHGTGGAMLMAGGALNGGRVVADWPGLTEADLYNRRDLMPTRDLRAHLGWFLRQGFGMEQSLLESTIFPGMEMGANPGHLL